MPNTSIYQQIRDSLTDEGRLPPGFSLPDDTPPNQIRFMAGAKDGVFGHHAGGGNPEKAAKKVLQLLKSHWKTGDAKALEKVAALLQKHGTLSLIDPLLNELQSHHDDVEIGSTFSKTAAFMTETADSEMVKLGIAVLGIFDLNKQPDVVDMILTLGLCEEFTLYAIVAALRLDNGNDLIFRLAQKVDGWGKIEAVERLKPETEEIRDWLLRKGCSNMVMDAYLGLECAEKGNLIGALRKGDMDDELFDGICTIIVALLDEGPCEGISAYEHAEEALRLFLQIAAGRTMTLQHLWQLLNVRDWLEECELPCKDDFLALCDDIVRRDKWPAQIHDALSGQNEQEFFYASNAASRLGIDVSALLYEAVQRDPVGKNAYLSEIYHNPEYAAQLTALYERTLPLEQLAAGMGDDLFADEFSKEHWCLDSVVRELHNYPGMGEALLLAAIRSPVVRERNGACKALTAWAEQLGEPVRAFAPELHKAIENVYQAEVNKDTKEQWKELLKG